MSLCNDMKAEVKLDVMLHNHNRKYCAKPEGLFFFCLFPFLQLGFNQWRVNASTNMPGRMGILKSVFLKKREIYVQFASI